MSDRFRLIRLTSIAAGVIVVLALALTPGSAYASGAEKCASDETGDLGDYYLAPINNVWNAHTEQCITVHDGSWEVTRSDHYKWGPLPAAYPASYTGCHWGLVCRDTLLPLPIYQISEAPADLRFSGANAPGKWSAAFDLWFHTDSKLRRPPDGAEISIWLDRNGGARPPGQLVESQLPLLGTTWQVYLADGPGVPVLTYLRSTPTTEVADLDLYAFIQDAQSRGHVEPHWYWSAAEAGFMLWHGGVGLKLEDFSVYAPDDVNRSDYIPPSAVSPPPPPPLGDYCGIFSHETRHWTTGYIVHSVFIAGADIVSYRGSITLPPGMTLEGWWNVDLVYDGDTIYLEPLTYQGPEGERILGRFGVEIGTPFHEDTIDFPRALPRCDAEIAEPVPGE